MHGMAGSHPKKDLQSDERCFCTDMYRVRMHGMAGSHPKKAYDISIRRPSETPQTQRSRIDARTQRRPNLETRLPSWDGSRTETRDPLPNCPLYPFCPGCTYFFHGHQVPPSLCDCESEGALFRTRFHCGALGGFHTMAAPADFCPASVSSRHADTHRGTDVYILRIRLSLNAGRSPVRQVPKSTAVLFSQQKSFFHHL